MTKLLVVTRCSSCPFFEEGPLKKFGGPLVKALMPDEQHGVCNLLPSGDFVSTNDLKPGLPSGSEREAEEPRFAQAQSRHDDWTITIAGGN